MSRAPKVGDVVLFTFSQEQQEQMAPGKDGQAYTRAIRTVGQSVTVPATVVSVHGSSCVNLRVHPDGTGPDLWETSVMLKSAGMTGRYFEWPADTVPAPRTSKKKTTTA